MENYHHCRNGVMPWTTSKKKPEEILAGALATSATVHHGMGYANTGT